MDVGDCFKERILKKIPISLDKVKSSIKIAELKLEESKKLFNSEFFNQAVLSSYTSMFHIARALLYSEGIQEKSHYAVYIYLREKYTDKIPNELINSFYNYQKERHNILYGFEEEILKEDAENSILDAEEFLNKILEIINID